MRCGCGGWCILGDQNVGKAIRLGPGPERGFDTPVSVEERCKKRCVLPKKYCYTMPPSFREEWCYGKGRND